MNLIRLMIWKEFVHIRSDKMTVRLLVFPVLAQILILGYALVTEIKNTPVTIVDRSNTPLSASLVSHISTNGLFKWKGLTGTEDDARLKLDRGVVKIVLVIPGDFARDLGRGVKAHVQLLLDGQDANSANVAGGYITSIISGWGLTYLKNQLVQRGIAVETMIPVKVNPVVLFNPLLKSSWYMIPALVAIMVTIVTALLTGLSIVKEKESGTLEQLMVTPVEPIHLILGKTIPYMIIGVAEILVFLVLVTFWFRIPFRGNVLEVVLFGIIFMMSSLGIGIFASTIAKTPQQVLFLIWFILMFFILLSGFFIPVENMPPWVQSIATINPVRYFMAAVRAIFLKGSSLRELWPEALSMFTIGIMVFGASIAFFHRRAA